MNIGEAIIGAVRKATADYSKNQEQRYKDAQRADREWEARMRFQRSLEYTFKEAAFKVMAQAYRHAAGSHNIAHARQVMYAARPHILKLCPEKSMGKTWDQYFTQKLLPQFVDDHPDETAGWRVIYDARGHLREPHTGVEVGLGTIEVGNYLAAKPAAGAGAMEEVYIKTEFPTRGPGDRYGTILFIEKEGFVPLFKKVGICEKYDVAIMSSKGFSSVAARSLLEEVSEQGVRVLALHDFDADGMGICATLSRDTERYQFTTDVEVEDLGLRLADIEEHNLEPEPVSYSKKRINRATLRENGATDAEIEFLAGRGLRVELNVFTTDQLVEWVEGKLKRYGVEKVVPDDKVLASAYRRAVHIACLNREAESAAKVAREAAARAAVPKSLDRRVRALLAQHPGLAWDAAIARLAAATLKEEKNKLLKSLKAKTKQKARGSSRSDRATE